MTGLPQPVLIVGTGLIGTSLALSLRRRDVVVWLADRDPEAVAVAVQRGAGQPFPTEGASAAGAVAGLADGSFQPALVVVAVPPAVTASVVADALHRFPAAVVTDVASVKVPIHRALVAAGVDASR